METKSLSLADIRVTLLLFFLVFFSKRSSSPISRSPVKNQSRLQIKPRYQKKGILSLLEPCRDNFAVWRRSSWYQTSNIETQYTATFPQSLISCSRVCLCIVFYWMVWAVVTSNCFESQIFRKTKENPSCLFQSLCTENHLVRWDLTNCFVYTAVGKHTNMEHVVH